MLQTEQIDELLTRYGAAEARIAANLLELDEHPTYKILSAGGLRGTTLAQVGPAMEKAPELWRWLSQLQVTLNDARDIRDAGRMNSERRERLSHYLTGPSILLHVDERSLAQRDLLDVSSADVHGTIDQLLHQMRSVYEPIRDAVATVDQVWTEVVPRTSSGDTTLERLKNDASRLGISEPTLTVLQARLRDVKSALAQDPMSLSGDYAADLDGLITEATHQMATIARGYDELDGDIAESETHLAELRVLRNRAATAHTQAGTKIVDAQGLIRTPDVAIIDGERGLASMADALRTGSDDWQQKRQELDEWMAKVVALREQLSRAYEHNSAPLRRRDELRGLLAAYWAKAAAVGRSEDPMLSDLHDDAHAALFISPTDLDRATMLVSAFGNAMRLPANAVTSAPEAHNKGQDEQDEQDEQEGATP